MATNLFKLVGSIYVDADKANESLQKTDEKANKVGEGLKKAGKAAGVMGAAAVAATGAAVKGALDQAKATAEMADAVDKGAQKMGISTDEYQKLSYAAELSGTSIDKLAAAQVKLQKAGSDLDINGALEQLYAIEDADERAAAAHEMFGDKMANELAPLLNAGGESFAQMKQQAEDLGMVMSGDTIAAGTQFGDTMETLNKSIEGAKNTLGAAFLPVFQTVGDLLVSMMPEIQQMAKELAPVLADMLKELAPMIMEILPLLIEMLPTLVDIIKAVVPLVLNVAQKVLPYLINVVESLLPIFESVINFLTDVFEGNWSKVWDDIVAIFTNIWESMKAIFTEPINFIIDGLNKFIGYLNTIKIPDWVPGVGGKGINIPNIPKLAVGIDYVPADNYPALLHRGEQVLTAEEAARYKNTGGADMSRLYGKMDELVEMFRNGTAKTDSNITNTRDLRAAYAT